jgi:2-polyprenyl-3-methyl-5-hydroxy-6-metoxy-1,4-benzoquinol methylase
MPWSLDKVDSMKEKVKIEDIRNWWNTNSYSYGINSGEKYRDTGIPDLKEHEKVFAEYERKYRKHLIESFDQKQRPAGQFVPYEKLHGKSVLDVAMGLGWASINMARSGANVIGIDLTPNAVDFASKYAAHENLQIRFLEMSAEDLKFEDSSFDFVLGWGFLMHTENPADALNELIRVCRPGGEIVLYFYYKHSITFWLNIFLLRGIFLGQLIRYRGSLLKLVSRNTDGDSFGGNMRTEVLSRNWFYKNIDDLSQVELAFKGWGPPSLLDSFPISKLPFGKLLPGKVKQIWSSRYGFGHILTIYKK